MSSDDSNENNELSHGISGLSIQQNGSENSSICDPGNQKSEPEAGSQTNGHQTLVQQPAARELTQTDHLNKRLLNAFLERMNRDVPPTLGAQKEVDNDAEWEETSDKHY